KYRYFYFKDSERPKFSSPSLHDALPILSKLTWFVAVIVNTHEAKTRLSELLRKVEAGEEIIIGRAGRPIARLLPYEKPTAPRRRSEEHTSELQSRENLVCRLLLEKKNV